jgi:hypothetical protein
MRCQIARDETRQIEDANAIKGGSALRSELEAM